MHGFAGLLAVSGLSFRNCQSSSQAFDPVSGEPKRCVEMEGWPRMERMMDTFGATVSRALLESFYATPSTEGLSVIFNRCLAHVCCSSAPAASARPLLGAYCRPSLCMLLSLHVETWSLVSS